MTPFDAWVGPAIVAATIAALVNVLGWVVAARREAGRDRRLRLERVRDVQSALVAEIQPTLDALKHFDLAAHLAEKIQAMRDDPTYIPFVPTQRSDPVFRAILAEIHVLPAATIRPVGQRFRDLRPAQREAMYADYISLKIHAIELGHVAVQALERSLEAKSLD